MLIRLENVNKAYTLNNNTIHAVRDISLTVADGEFVGFSGPSGSGKSTLFSLIAGMTTATSGRVLIDGVDIGPFSRSQAALMRRRLFGFVFQSFNLMPVLTGFENIELPLLLTGLDRAARAQRVHDVMERLEIISLARHYPSQMSGGQKQRVAVARALVSEPRIIVADEPTANLDSRTGQLVLEIARERCRSRNVAFLFSSHDAAMITQADCVIHLRDGMIAAQPQDTLMTSV